MISTVLLSCEAGVEGGPIASWQWGEVRACVLELHFTGPHLPHLLRKRVPVFRFAGEDERMHCDTPKGSKMSNENKENVDEILELALAIQRDLKDMFVGLESKLDLLHANLLEISDGFRRHNRVAKKWTDAMIANDPKLAISYLPEDVQARLNLQ